MLFQPIKLQSFCILTIRMFNCMYLCPQQIMWKMNELHLKIDQFKVAYFVNTRNKVRGLFCKLLIFVWFINQTKFKFESKCCWWELYFFMKQLILSICKLYYFENQKCFLLKIWEILQNHFAVNEICFTIWKVWSKNFFPEW